MIRAVLAVACCTALPGANADSWRLGASAGIKGEYTNNVNYAPQGQESGDFVTSLSGALNIRGEGARVKLNGSIAASMNLYSTESQNNSIDPNVSLFGSVEAIEDFFFVEATANVSTSFLSPFGPQPANVVNATSNRYTQQTYTVSPYIQGVLGSTNISYQVRNDNIWTVASSFGDSSNSVPNTYANNLTASLTSGSYPMGWRAEYNRYAYDNGLADNDRYANNGRYVLQIARAILTHQVEPSLQVSGRVGYEDNQFLLTSSEGLVYGAGFEWNPSNRTSMGGFWEHRYFGSSFDWHMSHRLPNSAISASFTRGLSSYPQLALAIPAGTTVTQFLDAAFTTRIPDPAERAQAIDQFLARTGLPPTLAAPVNFYGTSITLQNAQNLTYVLIGLRNAITFSLFNVKTEAIAGTGDVLPPAFQFGQNYTETGAGVGFSHQFSPLTNLAANARYSRTRSNDTALADITSNNGNFSVNLNTRFSPKTSGTAGITYDLFKYTAASNTPDTDAVTIFVSATHTF